MECREVQEHLSLYGDRGQESELTNAIREHLKVCSSCARAYELQTTTWSLLDIWEDAAPPDRLRKKVLVSLQERMRLVFRIKAVLSVAAVMLILLGTVVYYAGSPDRKPEDITARNPLKQQPSVRFAVNEEEVISHLDILQEEEFFDAMGELVRIDYLPLIDEFPRADDGQERSSLDVVLT